MHALAHLRLGAHQVHQAVIADAHPAIEGVAARLAGQWLVAQQALAHRQRGPADGQGTGHGQRGEDEMTALHGPRA